MANRIYNLPFRVDGNTTNAPIVPFTLAPGQTSAFNAVIKIDYTNFIPDASGVMISAVNFSGSQMNGAYAGSYPVALYSLADANGITFTMTATGANTYVAKQHTGTFTMSAMSPWVSGGGSGGASVTGVNIDFSSVPAVCSLNIYFSTANVAPSVITGFTAVASGDQAVGLTWTNPTGTGLSSIKLVYKLNAIPSTVSDGTVVVLASSVAEKFVGGLTADNGEYYGFAAYVIDTDSQASTQVATSAYPVWQPGQRAWKSHAEHVRMRNMGYI